jgi:hypothetical protein
MLKIRDESRRHWMERETRRGGDIPDWWLGGRAQITTLPLSFRLLLGFLFFSFSNQYIVLFLNCYYLFRKLIKGVFCRYVFGRTEDGPGG